MRRHAAVLALLVVGVLAVADDKGQHVTVAGRDVPIWKPQGAAPPAGYPLILFSHGFGGCNTQSVFLMEALARAGYLVLAPNHQDAHCGSPWDGAETGNRGKRVKPEEPFRDQSRWTDATYRDREQDMRAVLDAALRGRSFEGVPVDAQRVGVAGHSLGGYTALGVAGAWPSWKDRRVKAVLALAAYTSPYVGKGDLAHLAVPVMYQGGTRDLGVTPTVRRFQGAYDRSSKPKYYVEFDGAGHFAWTNINRKYQDIISRYSIAFFGQYLKTSGAGELEDLTQHPPREVSFVKSDVK